MKKNNLFLLLFFCFLFSSKIFGETPYFIEKDVNEIKPVLVNKEFIEPDQQEKDGIDFNITPNFINDNYSILYENKIYDYNLPIKQFKKIGDFTNNPLEGIRCKQLIAYFENYKNNSNKNFKYVMKKADYFLFDYIQLPQNRKIKIDETWTEYTNIITNIDKAKRTLWLGGMGYFEGQIDGTFLSAVDKYHFNGIVEYNGIRYAIIEADMSLIINYYVFGAVESRAFINKGRALIAYDYKQSKIKEIIYDGFYNCYAKGSLTNPLDWANNIAINADIQELKDETKKVEKKYKIGEQWGTQNSGGYNENIVDKAFDTAFNAVSGAAFNSMVIKAKKISKSILEIFSKFSSDEVLTVIDNGLRSNNYNLKHDNLMNYKSYYLYNK